MILEDRNVDLVSSQNLHVGSIGLSLNHICRTSCQVHMDVIMPKEGNIRIHCMTHSLVCKCNYSTLASQLWQGSKSWTVNWKVGARIRSFVVETHKLYLSSRQTMFAGRH